MEMEEGDRDLLEGGKGESDWDLGAWGGWDLLGSPLPPSSPVISMGLGDVLPGEEGDWILLEVGVEEDDWDLLEPFPQ